jgi:hypothetical protein
MKANFRKGRIADVRHLLAVLAIAVMAACSWADLVSTDLPPDVADPEAMKTPDGALALYHGTVQSFREAFGSGFQPYIVVTGRLTDELSTGKYLSSTIPPLTVGSLDEVEERDMPEDQALRSLTIEQWYRGFNLARTTAVDAIYYLQHYSGVVPRDLVAQSFSIRGYSMLYLADALCSGIPLTDYRSTGGFNYASGVSTDSVYALAVVQFDSALSYVSDSADFRYFAQVGKARALLNLGKFAEAKAAAQDVPVDFVYLARYAVDNVGSHANNFTFSIYTYASPENMFGTIGDNEGGNGLPFASSADPRVPTILAPMQDATYPLTQYRLPAWLFPTSAPWNGLSTEPQGGEDIVVSSGIEAQLALAEVAAQNDDPSFLTILNMLRTTCVDSASCPVPAPAGAGGVEGLPPLVDPGARDARIKMVFDERAYWLFLTGHRQGDLRRLVRVYGWPEDEVYPTGSYAPGGGQYGRYTNLPVPFSERSINTSYKGCINRDA